MFSVSTLFLATVVVIVPGVILDDAVLSAIIGGVFLVIAAAINSFTVYAIKRDEHKNRQNHPSYLTGGNHRRSRRTHRDDQQRQ